MIGIALFLLILILFELGALRWGVSSADDINSREWERRRTRGYWML